MAVRQADRHATGPSALAPLLAVTLGLLASRAGEWLYTSEIADELKLEHGSRSAAGMFGAFGRRAAHRYDGAKPWISEWDRQPGEARHRMSADVAAIVSSL